MSSCSDHNVGQMLHAYELGMLEQDEERQFEIHMIECNHCRAELARSSDLATLIRSEPNTCETTDQLRDYKVDDSRSWFSRNYVPVSAMLAVLCLILIYPAFHWVTNSGDGSRHVVPIDRVLTLLQSRSESDNSSFKPTERIVLVVGWAGVAVGKDYNLTITRADTGDIVYYSPTTRFNESGLAELLIEPNTLPTGNYVVRISNSNGTGEWDDLAFQCK